VNRILFEQWECQPDGNVVLTDQRATHIREVLRATVGQVVQVGVVNGLAGTGALQAVTPEQVRLAVTLNEAAPQPWIDLLLAVPRPKVLKRLWAQLAALGVGRIVLLSAARVERDYFATHWIQEAHYRPLLLEGLTQAGTTRLPLVTVERRFRPFVEDRLEAEFPGARRLVAHPGPVPALPGVTADPRRPLLAIGPEGGWSAFELDLLAQRGFVPVSLGCRTLRTDTACVALLAVLGVAQGWQGPRITAGNEA
jgi:RsmE family RNA methyltransferase